MKTIKFHLILLLLAGSVCMYADGLTATLQHGETMTAFYGATGLQSAYNAAADGDVITLSPGQFASVTTIAKSVRIVGAYGNSNTAANATYLSSAFTVSADNVTLEGMSFKGVVTLGAITNCTIKRCWISSLKQSGTHTNTLISQCVLQVDEAIATGVNYGIRNSTIGYFGASNNASNVANITNCYIVHFYEVGTTNSYRQPFAVYKNNVIRIHKTTYNTTTLNLYSPSEFYYNYFYQTQSYGSNASSTYVVPSYAAGCVNKGNSNSGQVYLASFPDKSTESFTAKGEDGKSVGVTGGEGWQEYPGIPRITYMKIDAQTDDKGKLNATINVQAVK